MFEFATQGRSDVGQPRRGVAFGISAVVHMGLLLGVTLLAVSRPQAEESAPVDVKFIRPGAAAHNAPPPPPPPPKKKARPHAPTKIVAPVVVPDKPAEPTPDNDDKRAAPADDDDDDGAEGGVEGGVPGGVAGGVVGGQLGNPLPAAPPKNVPAFVMDKDIISRPLPRLSEVFKQSHRRVPVSGMYKVCVGLDGHVYEVTPVKGVPGADEDIMSAVRDWLYKPRQVPACFLYNFAITITE